jgi:hypothetical protein
MRCWRSGAADQRRVESARDGGSLLVQDEQALGDERAALALQLERVCRLGLDGVTDEAGRLRPEQDLARRRRLLEPGGHVHRIAGRQSLVRPDHHLAGVEPDPRLDIKLGQGVPHLDRRPLRAGRRPRAVAARRRRPSPRRPMNFSTVPPWRSTIAFISSTGPGVPAAPPGRRIPRAQSIL